MLIFTVICGCLEPYNPEIPDSKNEFLIVDGLITDKSGPYTVQILKSSSFNDDSEYVSGLEVSIEELGGSTELLEESSAGVYQTHNLQGVVGNSYRLNISYRGLQYQSTWETINASPAIDSIYSRYEVRGTTDKENDQEGLQFFVDNHGPENGTKYFRYEWIETWEIGVYWASSQDYLGYDMSARTTNPVYQCWKTRNSTGINIGTTDGLTENILSEHPLVFAPKAEERFTQRYSLLVKQYALQEAEYTFWKKLKEANQEQGTFFDKQPANVMGNISSVTNSGDVALGYFSASGSQEVRIFLDRSEVPPSLGRIPACAPLDSLLKEDFAMYPGTYETTLVRLLESGGFFIDFILTVSPFPVGAVVSTPLCSDCTAKGGDLTKPEFWDE
jgi:hypothetical protein